MTDIRIGDCLAVKHGSFFSCIVCGSQFWRKPSAIAKGDNKFCSKSCYFIWQRGRHKGLLMTDEERRTSNILSCKKYHVAHREESLQEMQRWSRQHPEERRLMRAKRRALKKVNTPIDELLTPQQWGEALEQYHHRCAYCGRELPLTIDHVIPLVRGGKHSKDNVVPACSYCNISKGARTLEEWGGVLT